MRRYTLSVETKDMRFAPASIRRVLFYKKFDLMKPKRYFMCVYYGGVYFVRYPERRFFGAEKFDISCIKLLQKPNKYCMIKVPTIVQQNT